MNLRSNAFAAAYHRTKMGNGRCRMTRPVEDTIRKLCWASLICKSRYKKLLVAYLDYENMLD